jgi:hypothetical protein
MREDLSDVSTEIYYIIAFVQSLHYCQFIFILPFITIGIVIGPHKCTGIIRMVQLFSGCRTMAILAMLWQVQRMVRAQQVEYELLNPAQPSQA